MKQNITILSTETVTINGKFGPFKCLIVEYIPTVPVKNPFVKPKKQFLALSRPFYKKNKALLTAGDYEVEIVGREWTEIKPL